MVGWWLVHFEGFRHKTAVPPHFHEFLEIWHRGAVRRMVETLGKMAIYLVARRQRIVHFAPRENSRKNIYFISNSPPTCWNTLEHFYMSPPENHWCKMKCISKKENWRGFLFANKKYYPFLDWITVNEEVWIFSSQRGGFLGFVNRQRPPAEMTPLWISNTNSSGI